MSQQRIEIVQEFTFPVSKLFAFLSVHENLEQIFAPVKIRTIRAGSDAPNGVGSTNFDRSTFRRNRNSIQRK